MLHGIVAPPLPYRMRLDVVLDDWFLEQRIAALVHGDLEGAATLTFDGDGTESRAHAVWAIEMMQRPMRIAARVAHPLLRWGHDRVVDATVDGFRRHLVAERGALEDAGDHQGRAPSATIAHDIELSARSSGRGACARPARARFRRAS